MVLRLDLGQIRFNLVESAFVTGQLALLATKIMFYELRARACAEIKLGSLGEREMLWEHEPQASVFTAFLSSPKLSRVFL